MQKKKQSRGVISPMTKRPTIALSIIILCLTAFSSCRHTPSALEQALSSSGSNRTELERVLTHYAQNESDSLHLKAARFLIENMPGHYELSSPIIDSALHHIDSLYPQMPSLAKATILSALAKRESPFSANERKEDVRHIKAEFLIRHIDNAVTLWRSCPWLEGNISFDGFCEYILPYRIANEPLLAADSASGLWRDILREMDAYHYTPTSMDDIRSFLNSQINNKHDKYFHDLLNPQLPGNDYKFDCLEKCYYDVIGFHYAAIPSAIDFIPDWATRNGRHYWRTIIEPQNLNDNLSETQNPRTAKVYRITYAHNAIPIPDGTDSIPELFTEPFCRDVTEQYVKVSDLSVKIDKKTLGHNPKYVYLSIFNDLEWKPIAWAENKRGKATFSRMGRNLVYLPVCFRGGEMHHTGYPIRIDVHGNATRLQPDMKETVTLKLTRKYPLTYSKISWGKSLVGCCVEASNYADFSVSDTLAVLEQPSPSLNWMTLPIRSTKPYRYWRISKKGRFLDLGELEFRNADGETVKGEIITSGDKQTSEKAFDGDILTYCHTHQWIGIDCKKRTVMKEVRCCSRTDGNGIYPGHRYELSYFGCDGWQTVAFQTATSDSLVFERVPAGALYWLKNLTEGKEERIFTCENGQVRFW